MRIYPSSGPFVPIANRSVFTHLLNEDGNLIGGYDANLPAYIDAVSGTALSRGQVRSLSLSFGYGLRNYGAKRGDTILVFSPNCLAYPVIILGALAAGLRCTLANPAYTAHELALQYTNSHAHLIFTTEEELPTTKAMLKELGVPEEDSAHRVIMLGKSLSWAGGPDAAISSEASELPQWEKLLSLGSLEKEENFDGPLAEETALLCYSSGTTGKPKVVETTHKNIIALLDVGAANYPRDVGSVVLGFLPMYHIYGATSLLFSGQKLGLTVVIQKRFDPISFCSDIQKYKVTTVTVVPPVLVFLSRHPIVEKFDLSTLKMLVSGAAPLGIELSKQVTKRLRSMRASCAVVQGYGMTEIPSAHFLPPSDAERKCGSIGKLYSNLEARLVAGDIDAEEGQPGELWIRGPMVMKGYLNNSDATRDSMTGDGWYKTGDVAIRDSEGYYYIVDRVKELIKYKGYQVPPAELESVLLGHPDIADAAVIGVYDASQATELPRAYVVPVNPDRTKTNGLKASFESEVTKWMVSKVANHKHLRGGVSVIDVIPKSPAGKILRRELRELAKNEIRSRL
ncbi:AMP binding protein [Guyanagaster necrorhizus]|uniref:AMP binding protein n=1 Tax=Guyanagaster necrorhizus TaxID=856835 RepID=A0A9P8AU65_9AGAR|nr:AMP binding protein [Guyanagaster necrorhizus MCA 3950]KAG7448159.1 AMP binding protein [Guyanagaster necrorhizus MCA 3950]